MHLEYPYLHLARRNLKDVLRDDLIYMALSIIPLVIWLGGIKSGVIPDNINTSWLVFLAAAMFVVTYEFAESFRRPEELQGFGYGTYTRLIWLIYIRGLYISMQIAFLLKLSPEALLKRWGNNARALAKRDAGKWMYPVDAHLKKEGITLNNDLRAAEYRNMILHTLKLDFSPEDQYHLRRLLRELWPEYER